MDEKHPTSFSVIFKKMQETKEVKTIYSISSESNNIKELRRLSQQLNNPQPVTYSFS